jgi:outer membrane protein assembly factor BamB
MKSLLPIKLLLAASSILTIQASAADWPQFRGPQASGVAEDTALPVVWDIQRGVNVRWQIPIPGLAHASPIIRGPHIYLATAVNTEAKPKLKIGLYGDIDTYSEKEKHQWRLLCLEKQSGKILWDKLCWEAIPRVERHTKATHCNSTPATDGKRIVALLGSEGLFCFDMNGETLWHQDLGKLDSGPYDAPDTHWGFASSPVLHEGKAIVQCDTASTQFLAVFDASNGRELWRTARKEVSTWCTPNVATSGGHSQIIVNGWKQSGGYDLDSAKTLWWLAEGGDAPVASPIIWHDLAILTSAHGKYRPMRAVRLDATGDITPPEMGATNQAVIWCHPRKGNYLQTPIAVGDLLWGCSNDGIVTCFDAATGKIHYEERIGGGGQGFTASPVSANGKLYFTGELGDVFVLDATNKFTVVATNKLDGNCLATPAISDGALFFRTTEKLVAIADSKH